MNLCENVAIKNGKPVLVSPWKLPAMPSSCGCSRPWAESIRVPIRSGNLDNDDCARITSAIHMLSEPEDFHRRHRGLTRWKCVPGAPGCRECGGELGLIMVDYLQLMQVPGVENRVNEISGDFP